MGTAWSTEAKPTPPLDGDVARLAAYDLRGFTPGVHAGLPSRHLTVIVSFHDPIDVSGLAPGRVVAQAMASGLHAGPAWVHHHGTQVGVQLSIDPLASRRLLGVPAAEIASQVVDLGHLLPGVIEALERSWDRPFSERIAAIERMFAPGVDQVAPELEEAWRVLGRSGGTVTIDGLARHIGWSRRHLTQRFRGEFGIGPKELTRVTRFERARAMLSQPRRAPLARIAIECGYSDQAHFNREWRRLAGSSPLAWLEAEEFPFVQDGDGRVMGEWNSDRQGDKHAS
jgi:AraC-like DNA-binding protein